MKEMNVATMNQLSLDRHSFAAWPVMHEDPTRYAMHGICVDARGITGTNGKALVHIAHAYPEEIIYPVQRILARETVNKLKTARGEIIIGESGPVEIKYPAKRKRGKKPAVEARTESLDAAELDGHYPPYVDVLPRALTGGYFHDAAIERSINISDLRIVAEVFSWAEAVRIRYNTDGIISAAVRRPELGETIWTSCNRTGLETTEAGYDPTLIAKLLTALDAFTGIKTVTGNRVAADETAGESTRLYLPMHEGRVHQRVTRAMVITSRRKDGRTFTGLLMPLSL